MKRAGPLRGLLATLALVAGACASAGQPAHTSAPPAADEARAVVDFAGVDAWLRCARAAAERSACARESAGTRGGHIATLSMATFGDETPPVVTPSRQAVEALVDRMKAWPDALSLADRFLPARVGGGPLQVFVVANGHPWGDAYVRRVDARGGAVRLDDAGEPVVILNALLIASGYGGDAAEQATSAFGVLSHELFHALFRRYRAKDPAWAKLPGVLPPRQALQVIVLDEGVAHFVDRADQLLREGFPRPRADAALAALARADERLAGAPIASAEAEELLRAANQGRYWDKYGAIAGMLFAYGVHRAFGLDGLKEAVRCGPGRLVAAYARAAERAPDLPPLPERLKGGGWLDLCRPGT